MPGSNDLSEHVLSTIRKIIRANDIQSRRLVSQLGLTGPQQVIMKALSKQKETTVGELARQANLSQATVTNILDRLEHRGFVKRKRNERDKRQVIVSTTKRGSESVKEGTPSIQELLRSELDLLPEWEQTQILASLQRVAAMMEPKSPKSD